ncbi:MAG TPA: type III-B CRISPR module RAMP protein Cmr4 [Bryobacteraceae bacterium]|jgi:CRISPR-associated protein Cmr4|nr:type III-B CRISPR module RAMP protein Cmr4 [Bryobacteraceae bacterium]
MKTRPFLLHALSPLHAGTGHAADVIDLPTARMKATGIPFVPGSSIKGVLRDVRRTEAGDVSRVLAAFGPETGSASDHAGALVVGDARLLALPVRSFRGTFAWATSPLLLALAKRDLDGSGNPPIPKIPGRGARLAARDCIFNSHLYLEDLDLPAEESAEPAAWACLLAPLVFPDVDIFTKRFAIVDDETMTFLWETATQVDARVRLDGSTRTVASGALWLEESLPAETLLIGLLAADRSRRKGVAMDSDEVLDFALKGEETLQFGGKASTGRGRCRVIPALPRGACKS